LRPHVINELSYYPSTDNSLRSTWWFVKTDMCLFPSPLLSLQTQINTSMSKLISKLASKDNTLKAAKSLILLDHIRDRRGPGGIDAVM